MNKLTAQRVFPRRFARLFVVGCCLFASRAFPCLICEDRPGEEEKRVEELVAEKGRGALPELREILSCPACPTGARIAAARAVGDLNDRESIPALGRLCLALLDPAAPGPFGVRTGDSALRVAAAASLRQLGAPAAGEEIGRRWRELAAERQEEVPRLLSEFAFPDRQERLVEVLRSSGRDPVAFQAIVELRRVGDAGAAGAVRDRIADWRRRDEGGAPLSRMIRYAENTARVLLSRPGAAAEE